MTTIIKSDEKWLQKELGEIADFKIGRTPPRKEKKYWDNGLYNWISIADMIPFGLVTNTSEKVSEEAHKDIFRERISPKGTLLMSFKLTIGRTSKLEKDAYHNEAIVSIYPKSEVDTDYLFYYLPSINFFNYQDTAVKGKTLNKDKISKLKIIVPSLLTQKAIVHVLSTIQNAVTEQENLINKLKELKRSMMQYLFTKGTRGEKTKITEIGEIPESWKVKELGEVCTQIVGGGTPSTKNSSFWIGENPWITSKWLTDNLYLTNGEKFISDGAIKRSATHVIPEGALIFATRVGVGKVSINKIDLAINQDLAGLVINEIADKEFIVYQLRSDRVQKYIKSLKRGATIQGITREDMKKILIVLPNKKEQKDISMSLMSIDQRIEIIEEKLFIYQNLFKTLLHELMSGERRINFNI